MDVVPSTPSKDAPDEPAPAVSQPPAHLSNGADAPPTPSLPAAAAPPPLHWPPPFSLALTAPVSTDDFPYVTFDEVEGGSDDEEEEHWLEVAFSSPASFASPLAGRRASTAVLSSALQALKGRHRHFVDDLGLQSRAWQSMKADTARYLTACDEARALPLSAKPLLSAADVGQLDRETRRALNPLLTPCLPPLPPFARPLSSAPPPAPLPSTSAEAEAAAGDGSRKRRRVGDGGLTLPPVPSQRLVSGPLGGHVLQLLHIAQLKAAITREHRAQLRDAITDKVSRNAERSAATQRQPPPAPSAQPTALSLTPASTPLPPPHASPPAASVASSADAQLPPAGVSESSERRSAAAASRLKAFMAALPAETAAVPASLPVYSQEQLLSLLPPLVAVHFLHCGFTAFSHSALEVMAETAIDFIRTAGKAARLFRDRPSRTSARLGVKAQNGATDNGLRNGQLDEGKEAARAEVGEKEEAVRRRVLHQLMMGSEAELRRWYEERVAGAGARLKATETRLVALHHRLSAEPSDPFLLPNSIDATERVAQFSCEPFSPLQSLLHPPALPASPRPPEEDGEPPPLDQAKTEASNTSADDATAVAVKSVEPAAVAEAQQSAAEAADDVLMQPAPILPRISDTASMVEEG